MPYFPRLKSLPYFPGAKMTRYLLSRLTFLNAYVVFRMTETVINGKTTGKDSLKIREYLCFFLWSDKLPVF